MAEMCCGQKVSFSMAGMSCRQKVSFSMAGMCRRQKESVSAWLEYVVVKKLVSTGMGHAQKVSANRLNRFVRGIRRRSRRNRRLMVPRTDASYLVKKKVDVQPTSIAILAFARLQSQSKNYMYMFYYRRKDGRVKRKVRQRLPLLIVIRKRYCRHGNKTGQCQKRGWLHQTGQIYFCAHLQAYSSPKCWKKMRAVNLISLAS
jgi:hypothetical protein